MVCSGCNNNMISKIDNIFIEMFGHCWTCDHTLMIEGKITKKEFNKHQDKAEDKKYEK